jgi:hypothetical protein
LSPSTRRPLGKASFVKSVQLLVSDRLR